MSEEATKPISGWPVPEERLVRQHVLQTLEELEKEVLGLMPPHFNLNESEVLATEYRNALKDVLSLIKSKKEKLQ